MDTRRSSPRAFLRPSPFSWSVLSISLNAGCTVLRRQQVLAWTALCIVHMLFQPCDQLLHLAMGPLSRCAHAIDPGLI